MGIARREILDAANADGLDPVVLSLDPVNPDSVSYEVIPNVDAPLFRAAKRFKVETSRPVFEFPYGVIPSSEHDYPDRFFNSYQLETNGSEGNQLTIKADAANLEPLLDYLLSNCKRINRMCYTLHDYGGGASIKMKMDGNWQSETVWGHVRQMRFNLLYHGYVSFEVVADQGMIVLTDDKLITVQGVSEQRCIQIMEFLESANFEMKDKLYCICDISHWHYEHPKSSAPSDLLIELEEKGFEEIN